MKSENASKNGQMKRKDYEKELRRMQVDLCDLQDWVKEEGARTIILFEGRDAAGKGGTIKALTERVSPRIFRVVALPAPSDRQKTQLFLQRYIEFFPAAGEIVIFDRSWYNRAGVEYVMGFCDEEEDKRFLELCAANRELRRRRRHQAHQDLARSGKEEQEHASTPVSTIRSGRKLSPMDFPSPVAGTTIPGRATRVGATDTATAPWTIVRWTTSAGRASTASHIF